jgi:flagellar motor switch protein FliM
MNQQILSQDEVDALLQGITGESQKLEQEEVPQRRHPRLRPGQPGTHRPWAHAHDGDHQRALRAQHPHRPVQLHPQEPEVSIGGIKVQKYSAFLREIVVPTNFNIVSVKPLRGSGLIVCDPTLVFAVIDALFGGAGKFHTASRAATSRPPSSASSCAWSR